MLLASGASDEHVVEWMHYLPILSFQSLAPPRAIKLHPLDGRTVELLNALIGTKPEVLVELRGGSGYQNAVHHKRLEPEA